MYYTTTTSTITTTMIVIVIIIVWYTIHYSSKKNNYRIQNTAERRRILNFKYTNILNTITMIMISDKQW